MIIWLQIKCLKSIINNKNKLNNYNKNYKHNLNNNKNIKQINKLL